MQIVLAVDVAEFAWGVLDDGAWRCMLFTATLGRVVQLEATD
jgi:hypothetical protein